MVDNLIDDLNKRINKLEGVLETVYQTLNNEVDCVYKNPEVPVVGPSNPVVGYTLPKSDYDRIMEEIENAGV